MEVNILIYNIIIMSCTALIDWFSIIVLFACSYNHEIYCCVCMQ